MTFSEINQLSEIAKNLPAPDEQKTTIITNNNQEGSLSNLLTFISSILSIIKNDKKLEESND